MEDRKKAIAESEKITGKAVKDSDGRKITGKAVKNPRTQENYREGCKKQDIRRNYKTDRKKPQKTCQTTVEYMNRKKSSEISDFFQKRACNHQKYLISLWRIRNI